MIAENSISVFSNMLDDIKKFWFVSLIIFHGIFFTFYTYSIFTNLSNLLFLITYAILFILSILSFVLFLIKHKNKNHTHKKIVRHKNFLKYIVNTTMLIANIIELATLGIDDFSKIILIISSITLFAQIIIEFLKIFSEKYVKDLKFALEKDFGFLNIKNWKSTSLKIIDAPLEKLATLKQDKELSKQEIKLEQHKQRYRDRTKLQKPQKILDKKRKHEEARKHEATRVNKEIAEIKSHLSTIFKKDKENNTNQQQSNK